MLLSTKIKTQERKKFMRTTIQVLAGKVETWEGKKLVSGRPGVGGGGGIRSVWKRRTAEPRAGLWVRLRSGEKLQAEATSREMKKAQKDRPRRGRAGR